MIEIRACTPDDAAALSTLLSELGYTVPIGQATRTSEDEGRVEPARPDQQLDQSHPGTGTLTATYNEDSTGRALS